MEAPRLSIFSYPSVCKFAQVKTWKAQEQWPAVFQSFHVVFWKLILECGASIEKD